MLTYYYFLPPSYNFFSFQPYDRCSVMQSTLNIFQLDRVEWEDSYACNYVNRNHVESANKNTVFYPLQYLGTFNGNITLFLESTRIHRNCSLVYERNEHKIDISDCFNQYLIGDFTTVTEIIVTFLNVVICNHK